MIRIVRVGVSVRVDMQRDKILVPSSRGTCEWDRDRAVSANADRHRAGLDDAPRRLLDAVEGVENAAWRKPHISAIDCSEKRNRIKVRVGRIEAPDQD